MIQPSRLKMQSDEFSKPGLYRKVGLLFPKMSDTVNDDERQRLLAQYSEIATLAGGLAHEIRNPLSTMGLNVELLIEEVEDSESPRDRRMLKKLQRIQDECTNLDGILSAFLQFARVGELQLEAADLNAVVNEFVDFYRPTTNEHGVDISPHLESNLPTVRLDKSLFRQVLLNLARNAVQAMPDGGHLELQTFVRDGGVVLEIIDTGQGMNEKTRSKLFQIFFSTKPNGSGLGLPTVRKIVEAHNGTITCESEQSRGTRFSIELPAAG